MSLHPLPRCCAVVLSAALAFMSASTFAQPSLDDWGIDPGVLADGGNTLLRHAPDDAIDAIFQSVHAASQDDAQARALCGLFEPDADRSLQGLNAVAARLAPASRDRFAAALGNALLAAMQSPAQPYDAGAALQSLKAAGVTAALLHDGFVRGLNTAGNDDNSRAARCQSLRWLLDAMQARPQSERAGMTRWLLDQGLGRLATGMDVSGDARGR
jgi:hypothetical protein